MHFRRCERSERMKIRGIPTEKSETFPRMLGKCFWHFPSHAEGNSEVSKIARAILCGGNVVIE